MAYCPTFILAVYNALTQAAYQDPYDLTVLARIDRTLTGGIYPGCEAYGTALANAAIHMRTLQAAAVGEERRHTVPGAGPPPSWLNRRLGRQSPRSSTLPLAAPGETASTVKYRQWQAAVARGGSPQAIALLRGQFEALFEQERLARELQRRPALANVAGIGQRLGRRTPASGVADLSVEGRLAATVNAARRGNVRAAAVLYDQYVAALRRESPWAIPASRPFWEPGEAVPVPSPFRSIRTVQTDVPLYTIPIGPNAVPDSPSGLQAPVPFTFEGVVPALVLPRGSPIQVGFIFGGTAAHVNTPSGLYFAKVDDLVRAGVISPADFPDAGFPSFAGIAGCIGQAAETSPIQRVAAAAETALRGYRALSSAAEGIQYGRDAITELQAAVQNLTEARDAASAAIEAVRQVTAAARDPLFSAL